MIARPLTAIGFGSWASVPGRLLRTILFTARPGTPLRSLSFTPYKAADVYTSLYLLTICYGLLFDLFITLFEILTRRKLTPQQPLYIWYLYGPMSNARCDALYRQWNKQRFNKERPPHAKRPFITEDDKRLRCYASI